MKDNKGNGNGKPLKVVRDVLDDIVESDDKMYIINESRKNLFPQYIRCEVSNTLNEFNYYEKTGRAFTAAKEKKLFIEYDWIGKYRKGNEQ